VAGGYTNSAWRFCLPSSPVTGSNPAAKVIINPLNIAVSMSSSLRIVGVIGAAFLFAALGIVLAQDQDPSGVADDGVWVLASKNYNSAFVPHGNDPNDGFEDNIDEQEIALHESCVLYSVETSYLDNGKEIRHTAFDEYYWKEPPRILRPGEEIMIGASCSATCMYKPENEQYFDGCTCPSFRIYYGDCNTIWDEMGMAVTFPDGPILTCSARATDRDYEEGKRVINSAEETWLVPEHDTGDCEADQDKLTLKIMFMDRDLWGLVYYYNYTWQPGKAPDAIKKPEENGAPDAEKEFPACDRLKVSLEEASSSGNNCLLHARVVEICSGNEQGLAGASLQFLIWDKESADYKEVERAADDQGECTLEVPAGTWRVDVYASKEGYDEDWTNIFYCCGQGSQTSAPVDHVKPAGPVVDENAGKDIAQPAQPGNEKDIDISGRWNSSIGFVYDIQQSGRSFSWQVVSPISEQAQGRINAEGQVDAQWSGDGGSGSGSGTVEYSGNRAVRISWSNGVIFTR
jgi:hypothetical protein